MTKKSDYDLMIRVRHSEKSALSISARLNEIDARIKYHEDRKSADKKLAKIAEASAATVGLAGFRKKTRSGSLTAGGGGIGLDFYGIFEQSNGRSTSISNRKFKKAARGA